MRTIDYAKGFHPPTPDQQTDAIGRPSSSAPSLHLEPTESFFESVPLPTDDRDWLAQYNEEGQTYDRFLVDTPWLSTRKVRHTRTTYRPHGSTIVEKYPQGKIYVVQLGDFDTDYAPSVPHLVEYARTFFQLPVQVLPTLKLDTGKGVVHLVEAKDEHSNKSDVRRSFRAQRTRLNARFDSASGRLQLNVDTVLHYLRRLLPKDAFCLVALTMHDLFADSSDLFVAGMAAGNHGVGVFSFRRYDPSLSFSDEFWYEEERVEMNDQLRAGRILQRSCKTLVHEVSHILGLDHCIYFSCCMNGAGHLDEDFRQSMHLCPVDLRKLHHLCGFDVVKRYQDLLTFFTKHKMLAEKKWVSERLLYISKTS